MTIRVCSDVPDATFVRAHAASNYKEEDEGLRLVYTRDTVENMKRKIHM